MSYKRPLFVKISDLIAQNVINPIVSSLRVGTSVGEVNLYERGLLSFNRTISELKFLCLDCVEVSFATFNRTISELK